MAKTKSTAFLFLNSAFTAIEKQIDYVVSALNMHKAVVQDVEDKDAFIKGEEQGLSKTQEAVVEESVSKAQTFSEAEKLALQGSLYGQTDQVVQPGSHLNNLANVMHPCVIPFSIPVEGAAPKDGYLMVYSGQDFKHTNIMCCQGLAPAALTKHNVVKQPQILETNLDEFPQQLSYPWIVKISNSTTPGDIKYLLFYTAENQNIDGVRQNFSKIYMSTWTGQLDEHTGAMLGITHITALPVIDNNQDIQQIYAPYVEVNMDNGGVHIWFTGVDSTSNTSAIYYISTSLNNLLNLDTPLSIPLVPFLSLTRDPGLVDSNPNLKRKSGGDIKLSGHIISFRAALIENKTSSGAGTAQIYRYFWLSVECASDVEAEYITFFGKTKIGITDDNYNPDIYIENVVGDINDFPSATKRCFCPAIAKRLITQPDSTVNSPDIFDVWWSTGSMSKNYISYSGNKSYTSRTWVDSPASTVFNEALGFSNREQSQQQGEVDGIDVFTATGFDTSLTLTPLRLPVSLIELNNDGATFDLSKRIKFTTEDAVYAPEETTEISTEKFDVYTGRPNIETSKYLEDYTCKDGDTLDFIAAYYYNNKIDDGIPFGPLQFSGLIAEVNNICDADLYPGLKIKIPDPRYFNVRA